MKPLSFLLCLLFCFTFIHCWTWSEDTAFNYLYYSYAAYCNQSVLVNWSCKWCSEPQVTNFTPVAFPYNSKVNGFGFVGYHEVNQTIVVSFRGTQSTSIRNWIIDISSFNPVPYKNMTGILVGDGFYKEWNALKDQVIEAVNDLSLLYPNYSIWVTGHSLGAAVSVLCALELAERGYSSERIQVYNFGLPRVGNEGFSNYYKIMVPNTYRIVNGRDVVPHVPPERHGFYHVPTEVWENPSGSMNFKICSSTNGEDPKCSDSLRVDLSIYDHLHYLGLYEDCVSPTLKGDSSDIYNQKAIDAIEAPLLHSLEAAM